MTPVPTNTRTICRKESLYATFYYQSVIDTDFFNKLLLVMKCGSYISIILASVQWVNPEDLPEPEPKSDLHPKKVMLSVWLDFQEIVYWKLLSRNGTIDTKFYCQQLENLKAVLQVNRRKRRKVLVFHDNARPHTAKVTRYKPEEYKGRRS